MTLPKHVNEIDTPAVLINMDKVKNNLEQAQKYADEHGFKLRPHIKTHKIPELARMQLTCGAIGINCQKVSEALTMVDELMKDGKGASDEKIDVLITFNVIGDTKLKHLAELAAKAKVSIVADSEFTVDGYAKTAAENDVSINVLVECDMGGKRAGVVEPSQALALAKYIKQKGSLSFGGLMTYPAAGQSGEAALGKWLKEASQLFASESIPLTTVTVGGTPDMWGLHKVNEYAGSKVITEQRPGTYVYMDRAIMRSGAAKLDDCAQTVLATVVSKPTPTRAICDSGTKALSSDLLGMEGHGIILEYPKARVARLSEEHGVIEADSPEDMPKIGDKIRIVPNHSCVVTNLFDNVWFVNNENQILKNVPVAARGQVF